MTRMHCVELARLTELIIMGITVLKTADGLMQEPKHTTEEAWKGEHHNEF